MVRAGEGRAVIFLYGYLTLCALEVALFCATYPAKEEPNERAR